MPLCLLFIDSAARQPLKIAHQRRFHVSAFPALFNRRRALLRYRWPFPHSPSISQPVNERRSIYRIRHLTHRPRIPHTRTIPCSLTRSTSIQNSTASRSFTLLARLAPLSHLKVGTHSQLIFPYLHHPLYFRHLDLCIRLSASSNRSQILHVEPWIESQPQTAKSFSSTDALFPSLFANIVVCLRRLSHLFRLSSRLVSSIVSTASTTSQASCTTDELVRATHADTPHSISCNRLYAFFA